MLYRKGKQPVVINCTRAAMEVLNSDEVHRQDSGFFNNLMREFPGTWRVLLEKLADRGDCRTVMRQCGVLIAAESEVQTDAKLLIWLKNGVNIHSFLSDESANDIKQSVLFRFPHNILEPDATAKYASTFKDYRRAAIDIVPELVLELPPDGRLLLAAVRQNSEIVVKVDSDAVLRAYGVERKELYDSAILGSAHSIRHMKYLTEELAVMAVTKVASALEHVPKELKTLTVQLAALTKGPEACAFVGPELYDHSIYKHQLGKCGIDCFQGKSPEELELILNKAGFNKPSCVSKLGCGWKPEQLKVLFGYGYVCLDLRVVDVLEIIQKLDKVKLGENCNNIPRCCMTPAVCAALVEKKVPGVWRSMQDLLTVDLVRAIGSYENIAITIFKYVPFAVGKEILKQPGQLLEQGSFTDRVGMKLVEPDTWQIEDLIEVASVKPLLVNFLSDMNKLVVCLRVPEAVKALEGCPSPMLLKAVKDLHPEVCSTWKKEWRQLADYKSAGVDL